MSVNKFKVGDKVRVREGLVADEYYDGVRCASTMARMGGKVLTINHVTSRYYGVDEYEFYWSDEMLEPVEKTLNNLCAGDFVKSGNSIRKVLVAVDSTSATVFAPFGVGRLKVLMLPVEQTTFHVLSEMARF